MTAPLLCVVGARPNFMKIAAILPALAATPGAPPARLIHTGQHYDTAMKESFFQQLTIPTPDCDLGVGSGSHAVQTAEIMKRFETVLEQERPVAILVVGDVNSTIACALTAVKMGVPVIHVEAGLRSYDRTMPEEINRVLTDQIAALLFTTEREAADNLQREGVGLERIYFVGNVMIDTLRRLLPMAPSVATALAPFNPPFPVAPHQYALLTLHRPANVDDPLVLERLLRCVGRVAEQLPVLFPLHPRTRLQVERFGLGGLLAAPGVLALPPIGYLEMLALSAHAKLVLTDSGGVQEETTALGVPCLTLRENTERPITVTQGTNLITGTDPARIEAEVNTILTTGGKQGRLPELWDGRAGERIAVILAQRFGTGA